MFEGLNNFLNQHKWRNETINKNYTAYDTKCLRKNVEKIYSQTLQWRRSHNELGSHLSSPTTKKKAREKLIETDLNQELEIDIIGLWCCSFGLFALTSGLQIDPLCVQFKWKSLETKEEQCYRCITIRQREINTIAASGLGTNCLHSLPLHLQFMITSRLGFFTTLLSYWSSEYGRALVLKHRPNASLTVFGPNFHNKWPNTIIKIKSNFIILFSWLHKFEISKVAFDLSC